MKKNKKAICMLAIVASMGVMVGCQSETPKETEPTVVETTQAETTEVEVTEAVVTEVELQNVLTAVKEAYGENYIPSMDFDAQMLSDFFGISEDMYEEFFAQGPMISAHIDTFIGVKVAEGQVDAVVDALEAYKTMQQDATMQYPSNMPKAMTAEVVTYDDYVFFVMLGTPSTEAEEAGEEEALESAKESNQIALDVIATYFEG